MDLEHGIHWLHSEPTHQGTVLQLYGSRTLYALWLHSEPIYIYLQIVYTQYYSPGHSLTIKPRVDACTLRRLLRPWVSHIILASRERVRHRLVRHGAVVRCLAPPKGGLVDRIRVHKV
jgi:hypothetical protein